MLIFAFFLYFVCQRIVGQRITSNLKRFGAGLLNFQGAENDVDSNGYPDVAVSATGSDEVFVLLSKTVFMISANVSATPMDISLFDGLRKVNQSIFTIQVQILAEERSGNFKTNPSKFFKSE